MSNVFVIHSELLVRFSDCIPVHGKRMRLWAELTEAYNLFSLPQVITIAPIPCARSDLELFHTTDYLDACETYSKKLSSGENSLTSEEKGLLADFGLTDDCPVFPALFGYMRMIAGSSLTAASLLLKGARLVINWAGGRHHAAPSQAAGFCYVNDIVLAILRLLSPPVLKKRATAEAKEKDGEGSGGGDVKTVSAPPPAPRSFKRILYIDIDIHHGDGVESAFFTSSNIFTLSFHNYKPGFFPGSGGLDSTAAACGALNVPLKDGITDQQFLAVFTRVHAMVRAAFKPDVVVMQCGCDALALDPLGTFNLTAGNQLVSHSIKPNSFSILYLLTC
jgi:histone deacetylase 8